MYTGFKHLHSFVAYFVLFMVLVAILQALLGRSGKRPFAGYGRRWALFGLIAAHLQLLIGFVLYFISPLGLSNFSGENMGNSEARLYMLEHPLMMIISVVLITIGWSKAKRAADDATKHRRIVVWYSIALVLMLSRIPWAIWP